jgi:NAD(P)H-hydrate epimerase
MKIKFVKNTPKIWLKKFPWKKQKDHKYSRGKLVVLGSQKHMTGATILCAESALRVGTGSVKILCSKQTLPIYSTKFPSALKKEINNLKSLKYLIGPGAGSNNSTKQKTRLILRKIKNVVVDADALTCFKRKPKELYRLLDKNKVITPHPKEFHSIFPTIKKNLSNKEKIIKAIQLTKTNIVLKGHVTLIGSFDGNIVYNKHTSSELAVIGSGDVLSGLIASLIGKNKLNPFLAACAGVWFHGDLAKQFGPGLIAEDIIKAIPHTLKKLKKWKIYSKRNQ